MEARSKSLEELHLEYIELNKQIMNNPKQSQVERDRARAKVIQYMAAMKQLYQV